MSSGGFAHTFFLSSVRIKQLALLPTVVFKCTVCTHVVVLKYSGQVKTIMYLVKNVNCSQERTAVASKSGKGKES